MIALRSRTVVGGKFFRTLQSCHCHSQKCRLRTSSSMQKIPNNLKGKSTSSQEWLRRQLNDPYVKRAHEQNYRARSAFKLLEIDDKAKILKPGQTVVECGAAPGAWTQVIVKRINSDGQVPKKRIGTVIGIDLLPIAPLEGAIFLGGCDFTRATTLERIREILKTRTKDKNFQISTSKTDLPSETDIKYENVDTTELDVINPQKYLVDLVLSDMAPNATGQRDTDHPRIIKLVTKALEFAIENGKIGSHFLAKLWDGSETKMLESFVASHYEKVSRYKPPSSRSDSSEFFILAKYKKS